MYYSDLTDESLVMMTLAGEKFAYEELVLRHQGAAVSSALSLTHNPSMAEDAAQDAFVAGWMKLNTLKEPSKFRPWICMIAKNCARNTVRRYKSYICIDEYHGHIENSACDYSSSPSELYEAREEAGELHKSIDSLPNRIKEIIQLYYFDNLSIGEIAKRLDISIGTVKSQMHDGRKRIRRDLMSADEKDNDTLKEKVMKKIEELKMWDFINNKNGFEEAYKDVLNDIEDMSESKEKNHGLADVLMRGWWWVPGSNNDKVFKQAKQAALDGKNDEVIKFIAQIEERKIWPNAKAAFIRESQIPELEKHGFRIALGDAWIRLGVTEYNDNNNIEKSLEALQKALEILNESDFEYALAKSTIEAYKKNEAQYKDVAAQKYYLSGLAVDLRICGGVLRHRKTGLHFKGELEYDLYTDLIFRNASCCDGYFMKDGMKVGDGFIGSDGAELIYADDNAEVFTPSGTYSGCQVWKALGKKVITTWYKEGIGIVKQEVYLDGMTDVRLLSDYKVTGSGLIPLNVGNEWHYVSPDRSDIFSKSCSYRVEYSEKGKALLSGSYELCRHKYDENNWQDMIEQLTYEYYTNDNYLQDVSFPLERAEALAKTKLQKLHTKVAASVMRRIMRTDPTFNPDYTQTGHWNFFGRSVISRKDGLTTVSDYNPRWSFEWKNTNYNIGCQHLLYNNIFGILQDTVGCIMSDEWKPGAKIRKERTARQGPLTCEICCEDGGCIVTKAGSFENCLKVQTNISGYVQGVDYFNGITDYYFAYGVGIVRIEREIYDGASKVQYDLTSYEGTGEGYLPLKDGLFRRYDGIGITDGYIGWTELYFAENEVGETVCFSDRCGVRNKPEIITSYGSIHGETVEKELYDSGKIAESRLLWRANNLHMVLHTISHTYPYPGVVAEKIEWDRYRLDMLKSLGDGSFPPAFVGMAANILLSQAAALLYSGPDSDNYEKGFSALDECFELTRRWIKIPEGELLDVGNKLLFDGIKIPKGKLILILPDGTKQPITGIGKWWFDGITKEKPHNAMTAEHGWEWFDPARNSDRFKEYVEKAKKLSEE